MEDELVVHSHQEKFRPLPFDLERARRRRRRRAPLMWVVVLLALAWWLFEALR